MKEEKMDGFLMIVTAIAVYFMWCAAYDNIWPGRTARWKVLVGHAVMMTAAMAAQAVITAALIWAVVVYGPGWNVVGLVMFGALFVFEVLMAVAAIWLRFKRRPRKDR
jgi:hypothetical protein